ncbi:GNAT family N-acetyltransferase [Izhakiella australiensis]|uniref:GNAT family N-acetyltransferase n=1 Tax=Izhakiella australiensis TaxID=1926881 RepID=A0A1S8YIX9_9GAMM|nr:GNAT family N-acetyltransferase [Izhakiella australiensis]OON38777.1 GNAT family N-acetyltransferase [Izhakiella australiensis]
MIIRSATTGDCFALSALLAELGYPDNERFIEARVQQLIDHPDERLLIAADGNNVLGFLSLHFIPQLALAGDFARVSYFCVADGQRSKGAGHQLINAAQEMARERGCDRMELHCHERRTKALGFYAREGYRESSKYLIKYLT